MAGDAGRRLLAVGWEVGDLSDIAATREGKEELRGRIEHLHESKVALTRGTQQLFNFMTAMKQGDIIVAGAGNTVLGIGELAGDYYFEPRQGFGHRRPVRWIDTSEWPLPDPEAKLTTVKQLGKPLNLVTVEERLLDPSNPPLPAGNDGGAPEAPLEPLTGVLARVERALRRKGQVILYGPPGTGKTYHGERAVQELAARSHHRRPWRALRLEEQSALTSGEAVAIEACTFHPGYGYEDFIEGYRPVVRNGVLTYELTDGVFKRLCQRARAHPEVDHNLLIDEINRGDIPRILGELITLLEADKRGKQVTLPLSRESFSVPKNVFIVGTMNTADRSIALLDTALRRRFAFVELMPDPSVLGSAVVQGLPLGPWLTALNARIRQHVTRDARNLQIGHSYLMHQGKPISDLDRLVQAVHDDIIPLIEEYCYEDYTALRSILGETIVKVEEQRIDADLFEPSRRHELLAALLEVDPDLTASEQAMAGEADAVTEEDDEDDGEDDPDLTASDDDVSAPLG
ncbi:MAG: AAA family ATPase [Dehalococcoidia bacterium]|nr:AAA family ATPase [Dehalococcoidia bacterium]